jgi:CRP-like cAMP-binding protein
VADTAGIRIKAKLTHQEMANLIGCSRETVSATLGQFRDEGFIRMDGRTMTIVNQDGLRKLIG